MPICIVRLDHSLFIDYLENNVLDVLQVLNVLVPFLASLVNANFFFQNLNKTNETKLT